MERGFAVVGAGLVPAQTVPVPWGGDKPRHYIAPLQIRNSKHEIPNKS